MTQALDTIRREHESLAKVLTCLRHLAEALQEGSRKPDFEILYAILDYLEGFPDTYHHPKEEEFLFKALRRRRPAAAPLLDKLHEEHAEGVALAAELRAALEAYRRAILRPPSGCRRRPRPMLISSASIWSMRSERYCPSRKKP